MIKLRWPFSPNWLWIFAGAAYGLLMRLLTAQKPFDIDGAMSLTFLMATPVVIGALTLYGYRHKNFDAFSMIFAPWATTGLMMLGAAITLLEGSICIALMSPLFLGLSSVGGVIMGLAMKWRKKRSRPLLSIAALPLFMAMAEQYVPHTENLIQIQRSIVVNAQPELVWQHIVSAKNIQANELPFSISHAIGVPKPVEGINKLVGEKEIRYSVWERGVSFQAEVLEKHQNKVIHWRYSFTEDSFPKGSMDDHVAIGGKYFNLLDSTFKLEPMTDQKTRLTLTAHYRINTKINFYAVPVSKFLGRDFIDTILGLYRYRSERHAHQGNGA